MQVLFYCVLMWAVVMMTTTILKKWRCLVPQLINKNENGSVLKCRDTPSKIFQLT